MVDCFTIKTRYFILSINNHNDITDFYAMTHQGSYGPLDQIDPDIYEYFDSENADRISASVMRVRETGSEERYTEVLRFNDGNAVFDLNVLLFSNDTVLVIAYNETASVILDDQFVGSMDMFRLISESIEDLIWVRDIGLTMKYINPAVKTMLGFTPEEYMNKPVNEVMAPDSFQRTMSILKDELNIEKTERFYPDRTPTVDIEIYKKDGSTIWAEIKVKPLRSQGKVIGMIGVTRDISQRKRVEENLRNSEARYKYILDTMVDGYYEADKNGNLTFFNDAYMKIFGYDREELMGLHFLTLTDERGKKNISREFAKMYETGEPVKDLIFVIKRKNGSTGFGEASSSLLYDASGEITGCFGLIRDVTKNIEETRAIIDRNVEIEEDLKTAQLIQKSLIKIDLHEIKDIEADVRYLPLDAVGGDYFSIVNLDEGGTGVFIGDVASHGLTAALFVSLIRATTDKLLSAFPYSPKKFITTLNRELLGNMPYSFLTAIYGFFLGNEKGCKFCFSSGGHPPVIYMKNATGKAEFIDNRGTLISVFRSIKTREKSIDLSPGDRIFLYTDGIVEVVNRKNEILGFDCLLEIVEESNDDSLSVTLDNIIAKINHFREDVSNADDIVLLGFQV